MIDHNRVLTAIFGSLGFALTHDGVLHVRVLAPLKNPPKKRKKDRK